MLGFRLSLLPILFAGCTSGLLVVPDADWQQVPPAQRAAIDRQYAADLAAARAEDTASKASLAELRHAPPPPAEARPLVVAAPDVKDADDPAWAEAVARYDKASAAARTKVDAAHVAAQRADLAWREARVEVAEARLDVLVRDRELRRAHAVDRNLLGTDTYDAAPLRGQMSEAQKRWYAASSKAHHARGAYEHAVAVLSMAKESYAQLMRGGPGQASVEPPPSAPIERVKPHFELPGWAVTRSDITRRRGLRHYLEQAAASPAQLRWVSLRLSVRKLPVATAPRSGPEASTAPGIPAPTGSDPGRPASATKPAETASTTVAARPSPARPAAAAPPPLTKAAPPPAAATAAKLPSQNQARPAAPPAVATPKPATAAAKPTDAAAATVAAGVKPVPSPPAANAKPIE